MLQKKCFQKYLGMKKYGKKFKKFYNLIRKGNYGQSGLNEKILEDITKSRVSLYKKW